MIHHCNPCDTGGTCASKHLSNKVGIPRHDVNVWNPQAHGTVEHPVLQTSSKQLQLKTTTNRVEVVATHCHCQSYLSAHGFDVRLLTSLLAAY